ncbi:MAG: M56 family metallopeptidase [Gemmatimonadaceae bacterium]
MSAALLSAFGSLPGWNISLLLLLVKATVILVAALGITLAMQRASATARHLVWLVTLGTLLLVPALTAWAPIRLAVLPAATVAVAPTASNEVAVRRDVPPVAAPDYLRGTEGVVTQVPSAPVAAPSSATDDFAARVRNMSGVSIAITLWAAMVLAILLSLAWAGFAVHRIVSGARPLTSPDWETPMYEIADRLGLEELPRLLQSDEAKMPFACGMMTPTIVLPAESEGWSTERRKAVLLHELAHVRRHDLMGHTLGRLVCAVYWFHPLVWTAAKQLRNESERACDDLALSCGTRATDYAEHLLDIVTSVRGDSTPLVALAMARRKEFEGRMLAILDPDLRRATPTRRQSAVLIATLALISLTVGAVAPVARTADAAVTPLHVAKTSGTPAQAPLPEAVPRAVPPAVPRAVPQLNDAPLAAPMQKAYPDSGVRGEKRLRVDTTIHTSVSTRMSTAMSTRTSTSVSDNREPQVTVGGVAITALAEASARAGMQISADVLDLISERLRDGKGGKGDKGDKGAKGSKQSDDRPELLAKVLRTDSSASLRRIAAWGLQEYTHNATAMDALVNAVRRDSDARVREMAAWSLGQANHASTGSTEALSNALRSDQSERVRTIAAWALGNENDRSAVDGLVAALADPSADVRIRAAWALGNIGARPAPKALIALLGDKEPKVRQLAAWALYNIEDPSAVPALEAALKVEQEKSLQVSYIRALASMGDKSVDAIKGLLESPDQRVKAMAVRALAGGQAAGPWPWPWPEPRPFP